jgi:hypothetical protein
VLVVGKLWDLQKFLQCIKYIIVEFNPPHHSPLLPPSYILDGFNIYHFSIYIHVYTVFALYSLSNTLSPPIPPFHCYQPPPSPGRTNNNKWWWGCGGKRNPHTLLLGMYTCMTTMENSKKVPQKTKNRSAIWSNNNTPRV